MESSNPIEQETAAQAVTSLKPSEILRNARTSDSRSSSSPARSAKSGRSVPSPFSERRDASSVLRMETKTSRQEGEKDSTKIPEWRVRDSNQLNPDSSIFRPASSSQLDISALSRLSVSDKKIKEVDTTTTSPLAWRAREAVRISAPESSARITEKTSKSIFTTPPSASIESVYSPPTASTASVKTPLHLSSQAYSSSTALIAQKRVGTQAQLGLGGLEGTDDSLQNAEDLGRFLLINEIPRDTKPEEIKDVVSRVAHFKVVIVKHLVSKGCIFVVFYDPRQAMKLYEKLHCSSVQLYAGGPYINLHCMKVSRDVVEHTIGSGVEWERLWSCSESEIVIEVIGDHKLAEGDVESALAHCGDVMWVQTISLDGSKFLAEFYDTRHAVEAIKNLHNLPLRGSRLSVRYKSEERLPNADLRSLSRVRSDSEYTLGSAAYSPGTFHRHNSVPVTPLYPSRSADYDPFAPEHRGHLRLREQTLLESTPDRRPWQSPIINSYQPEHSSFSKHRSLPADMKVSYLDSGYGGYQGYETPTSSLNMDRRMSEPGSTYDRMSSPSRSRFGQSAGGGWNALDRKRIPTENLVYPEKIISGLDKRTTVMIKDVPNKLTRQELVDILDSVVPGGYDFVYLRFDFDNCCNVGYAFVNFSSVQSLYEFIRAKVGRKWNMFSSEKVLQVSYANIQGKVALINKFRNSAVMDVVEPWRPQIFYTSGTRRGQPEPFPESDNPAQRQRSADLRLQSLGAPKSAYGNDNIDEYQYGQFAPGVFDHGF